jgi:hypothetical protein
LNLNKLSEQVQKIMDTVDKASAQIEDKKLAGMIKADALKMRKGLTDLDLSKIQEVADSLNKYNDIQNKG